MLRTDFGPVAKAPRGKGPRTKKQAKRLRDQRHHAAAPNPSPLVAKRPVEDVEPNWGRRG